MPSFSIRRLKRSDYNKGFVQLLSQLTYAPPLPLDKFLTIFANQGNKQIFVLEEKSKIIGTASIVIDNKFTRGGVSYGYVEDVVVDKKYRGLGIGTSILQYALKHTKREHDITKFLLRCNRDMVPFYKNVNFEESDDVLMLWTQLK